MLKIAVFEDNKKDELTLLQYIEGFLSENSIEYKTECFPTFFEDLKQLISYDIIFLDIELGDKNGIDIGHLIRQEYPDLIIIITSRHPQYLIEGYKIDAKRYLLKPIEKEVFNIEFGNVLKSSSFKQNYGFYDESISPYRLRYSEIVYVESVGRKTYVHLKNNQVIECVYPLKQWNQMLHDKGFVRVHKSFIINLSYMKDINHNEIIMSDNTKLPLSRHYKQSFYESYYRHVRTSI